MGILIQHLQKFVVLSTSLFTQRFELHSLWQSPSEGQRPFIIPPGYNDWHGVFNIPPPPSRNKQWCDTKSAGQLDIKHAVNVY